MGRIFLVTLEGNVYSCKFCQTHLALREDIISTESSCLSADERNQDFGLWHVGIMVSGWQQVVAELSGGKLEMSFHCRHGRAYLFDKVFNVNIGEEEERMMITGMHTVDDIFCVGCGSIVGWKYETAEDKKQKYKEGKYILERFKVLGPDANSEMVSPEPQASGSDDPDEAE